MRLSLRTAFTVLCLSAGILILSSSVKAQEPAPAPAPTAAPAPSAAPALTVVPVAAAAPATPPAAPPSDRVVLKEGTEVPLAFSADLNSKTAVDDDTVSMTLADDLKVGDVVVVRKGAPAVATVTNAHKAGMMGKPGELSIPLEYVKSDDQRLRLRGNKGKEGEGKVGATVALTVLFGPIGLIKHGKNVDIPEGTPLTAYVDQDYTLAPAK
ncbi:MAG: hypothetical protein WA867_20515 [Candidatus Acidiferrales bacterium]